MSSQAHINDLCRAILEAESLETCAPESKSPYPSSSLQARTRAAHAAREVGDQFYKQSLSRSSPDDRARDEACALIWYRIAAEKDDIESQFKVGSYHYGGYGGEVVSYSKAFEWYVRAAEKGHALAQYNLGICYLEGLGVPQSYPDAIRWFRRSATNGYYLAQQFLAKCYAAGTGVDINLKEAFEWHRVANRCWKGTIAVEKLFEDGRAETKEHHAVLLGSILVISQQDKRDKVACVLHLDQVPFNEHNTKFRLNSNEIEDNLISIPNLPSDAVSKGSERVWRKKIMGLRIHPSKSSVDSLDALASEYGDSFEKLIILCRNPDKWPPHLSCNAVALAVSDAESHFAADQMRAFEVIAECMLLQETSQFLSDLDRDTLLKQVNISGYVVTGLDVLTQAAQLVPIPVLADGISKVLEITKGLVMRDAVLRKLLAEDLYELEHDMRRIRTIVLNYGNETHWFTRFAPRAKECFEAIYATLFKFRVVGRELELMTCTCQGLSKAPDYQDMVASMRRSVAQLEALLTTETIVATAHSVNQVELELPLALRIMELRQRRLGIVPDPSYIPVKCGSTRKPPTDEKDQLQEKTVEEEIQQLFSALEDDSIRSALLLGPSGSGKSSAMRALERLFWSNLQVSKLGKESQLLPIFMELREYASREVKGDKDLQEMALLKFGGLITKRDLAGEALLQLKLRPIWIFDAYDEMGSTLPLGSTLGECGLTIVSCRLQFVDGILKGKIHDYFDPKTKANIRVSTKPLYLRAFDFLQIEHYVTSHLTNQQALAQRYSAQAIVQTIRTIPSLAHLATNPYLLRLIVDQLPELVKRYPLLEVQLTGQTPLANSAKQRVQLKSSDILHSYVEQYFERPLQRLASDARWPTGLEVEFIHECRQFCIEVARTMFSQPHRGFIVDTRVNGEFQALFYPDRGHPKHLERFFVLQAVPLHCEGLSKWSFFHKSLAEYFYACGNMLELQPPPAAPDDEEQSRPDTAPTEEAIMRLATTLGMASFVQDRDLIHMHAELLADSPLTQRAYVELILFTRTKLKDSTSDNSLLVAASNAVTILNYAGLCGMLDFRFSDVKDWSGIRVPYANLNYAQILYCNFDHADLSTASLIQAVLRGSSFRGANLEHIDIRERPPLLLHSMSPNSISFSHDSRALASAADDRSICIWNVATGECEKKLQGHTGWISGVAFSPVSNALVTGSGDNSVRLWDVSAGECIAVLLGHSQYVTTVAFGPDGGFVASGSGDQTIRIWNVASKECIAILTGHTEPISNIVFGPDGNTLASASSDCSIRIWDLSTSACTRILEGHTSVINTIRFSPDGNLLASCSNEPTIYIWDARTGECISQLRGHNQGIGGVGFSPDGKLLVSGSYDDSVRIWDLSSGECTAVLQGHNASVTCVTFSPDGKFIGSSAFDNSVRIWNVASGMCTATVPGHSHYVHSVDFDPTGKLLASGSEDKSVYLWSTRSGRRLAALEGHSDAVTGVKFHPDHDSVLATSSKDASIRIWNAETFECVRILNDHTRAVMCVTFSYDGKLMASGSQDHTVRIWDVQKDFASVAVLQGHTLPVVGLAFSPNGKLLASSSDDRSILIWDVSQPDAIAENSLAHLQGHDTPVNCVCFSPDSRFLASAGDDPVVRIWDASSEWKCTATFGDHGREVQSVTFTPDGKFLITGSWDKCIRVWNFLTGTCVSVVKSHTWYVQCVRCSMDGTMLASASYDNSVRLFSLEKETCLPRLLMILSQSYQLDLSQTDFEGASIDGMLKKLTEHHAQIYG